MKKLIERIEGLNDKHLVKKVDDLGVYFEWPDPEGISQAACFSEDGKRIKGFSYRCGDNCKKKSFWEEKFSEEIEFLREVGLNRYKRNV